jgi:hypothetical protein
VGQAGFTPLLVASGLENLEVVEMLIGNGANVDARFKVGTAPTLHFAAT